MSRAVLKENDSISDIVLAGETVSDGTSSVLSNASSPRQGFCGNGTHGATFIVGPAADLSLEQGVESNPQISFDDSEPNSVESKVSSSNSDSHELIAQGNQEPTTLFTANSNQWGGVTVIVKFGIVEETKEYVGGQDIIDFACELIDSLNLKQHLIEEVIKEMQRRTDVTVRKTIPRPARNLLWSCVISHPHCPLSQIMCVFCEKMLSARASGVTNIKKHLESITCRNKRNIIAGGGDLQKYLETFPPTLKPVYFYAIYRNIEKMGEIPIRLCGLNYAGKSVVKRIITQEQDQDQSRCSIPVVGNFNVPHALYHHAANSMDVVAHLIEYPGTDKQPFEYYKRECRGLIYVIDFSRKNCLANNAERLKNILRSVYGVHSPILVVLYEPDNSLGTTQADVDEAKREILSWDTRNNELVECKGFCPGLKGEEELLKGYRWLMEKAVERTLEAELFLFDHKKN